MQVVPVLQSAFQLGFDKKFKDFMQSFEPSELEALHVAPNLLSETRMYSESSSRRLSLKKNNISHFTF